MGAFFTNIQLKNTCAKPDELTDKVIAYITKYNLEAGFIRVDNETEADKTVIILPSEDLRWISIYDEDTEDQELSKLNKLSNELSKQFKTTSLDILVNDSDSIYLGINVNGILKDSITNIEGEIDFNKSEPKIWTDILEDNYSFDDIEKAWKEKNIFVEDFLKKFAKFANIDIDKLLTGYLYLQEENPSLGIKLNFALKDKKVNSELGLTKFSMLAGAVVVDLQHGEKQNIEFILTNKGTFSTGIDIVISGECIEQSLLIPEFVKANYVTYVSEKQNDFTLSFIETISTTGQKIFYARIEDMYIPEGFNPTYPLTSKGAERYRKVAYDCAIKFNINFIGGNNGNGDFTIFFSPLINRQEGTHSSRLMKGGVEDWMNNNGL